MKNSSLTFRLAAGFGLVLLLAMAFLPLLPLVTPSVQGQPINLGFPYDASFRTLQIMPARASNGTNALMVLGKSGTNWLSIDPTNANFTVRPLNTTTQYTAVTATFFATNPITGTCQTQYFRNGLLIATNWPITF
jgi:hypothetical protein